MEEGSVVSASEGVEVQQNAHGTASSEVAQADPTPGNNPSPGGGNYPKRAVPVLSFTADALAVITLVLGVFVAQGVATLAIAFGAIGAVLALYYLIFMDKKKHWHTVVNSVLLVVALAACGGGIASRFVDISIKPKGVQTAATGAMTSQSVPPSSGAPSVSSSPAQPVSQPAVSSEPAILKRAVISEPKLNAVVSRCVIVRGSGGVTPGYVRKVGVRTFNPDTYYPLRTVEYNGDSWATTGRVTVGAPGDVGMSFEILDFEIPEMKVSEYESNSARKKDELERDGVRIVSSVPVKRLNKIEENC